VVELRAEHLKEGANVVTAIQAEVVTVGGAGKKPA
jgi:hypothetical protein